METTQQREDSAQPITEQQLLLGLSRKGISTRLLCCIGLPDARREHMRNRLEAAKAFELPSPVELEEMTEVDLDISLARKGVSTRLLSLIGLPEARVAAKRAKVMFSE